MKKNNFIDSFNYAVQGIMSSIKTEKNMKFHYLAALLVIFISLFFNLTRMEFMMIFFSVTFVLSAELFNTAIERTVDLITQEYNPIAKLVKDISAGAVLISAINAFVIAYLVFFDRLTLMSDLVFIKIRNSTTHLTFVAVIIVLLLTIGLKTRYSFRSGGTPFQGGAVSGHSALSFCIATIIGFITMNGLATACAFALAFLVAESRVEGNIHKKSEAILGAILGITVAVIIFKVIK